MFVEKLDLLETKEDFITTALQDYYLVHLSRQLSLLGRKEVHNGRAHFGIFGEISAFENCYKLFSFCHLAYRYTENIEPIR